MPQDEQEPKDKAGLINKISKWASSRTKPKPLTKFNNENSNVNPDRNENDDTEALKALKIAKGSEVEEITSSIPAEIALEAQDSSTPIKVFTDTPNIPVEKEEPITFSVSGEESSSTGQMKSLEYLKYIQDKDYRVRWGEDKDGAGQYAKYNKEGDQLTYTSKNEPEMDKKVIEAMLEHAHKLGKEPIVLSGDPALVKMALEVGKDKPYASKLVDNNALSSVSRPK